MSAGVDYDVVTSLVAVGVVDFEKRIYTVLKTSCR